MRIAKDRVVSLDVELSDIWGNLIERSTEPVQYLHGGYGDIFPAVEAALDGRSEKERVEVRLEPEDAFGDYDENLLRVEPRSSFPETLEVGMRFEGLGEAAADDAAPAGSGTSAGDDAAEDIEEAGDTDEVSVSEGEEISAEDFTDLMVDAFEKATTADVTEIDAWLDRPVR